MVTPIYRTLEQELQALARGISLECLVCGEFVLRTARQISCPECGSHLRGTVETGQAGLHFDLQAG
jgi:Zn finger protein HypA/HybF involved in hydrogenase expression